MTSKTFEARQYLKEFKRGGLSLCIGSGNVEAILALRNEKNLPLGFGQVIYCAENWEYYELIMGQAYRLLSDFHYRNLQPEQADEILGLEAQLSEWGISIEGFDTVVDFAWCHDRYLAIWAADDFDGDYQSEDSWGAYGLYCYDHIDSQERLFNL